MASYLSWYRLPRKHIFSLVVMAVVSVSLLIYFLPRESKFGYNYELNKPWQYADLTASFDFPILKTEQEIKMERDSVVRHFIPYYRLDTLVYQNQVAALREDFYTGKIVGYAVNHNHPLERLEKSLHEVYERGIIDTVNVSNLRRKGLREIRISQDKGVTYADFSGYYTVNAAYSHIIRTNKVNLPDTFLVKVPLKDYLVPNVLVDEARNQKTLESNLAELKPNLGDVQKGQRIINQGDIVTPQRFQMLNSLKAESENRMDPSHGHWLIFLGQMVFLLSIMGIIVIYLKLFRRDYFYSPRSLLLLFTLITLFPLITYALMAHNTLSVYLIPYAIVPMFVRIFLDSRTAFMALVVTLLLSALVVHAPFEFLLQEIIVGLIVIYSLRELTERSQLLRVVIFAVLAGLVVSTTYDLSQGLNGAAFDPVRAIHIVIGGALLLFAYPLMYLVEKLFGFTSSVTLVELNNINSSMLRRMSKEAQGTFNHSMQVANLAAEVADKIGGKPQLVRTGALYHDIGKLANPVFFTENQNGVNPHDKLTEVESAQIIISHVTEGLRLADKHHLPRVVRDFISTHHGAGLVKYFYIQYSNKHPEEQVDKALFTYPGPNPQTKEQAILMMCDAVEAASRSLKEYTEESISTLVNRIVDGQQADGYFRETPLTFRDVEDAKRTLIDTLKTIYHTRISYPELNKKRQ